MAAALAVAMAAWAGSAPRAKRPARSAVVPSPTAAAPASIRLDAAVKPLSAALALTLDPARADYRGTVDYELSLAAPRGELVLHARGPEVALAWVEHGAQRQPATVRRVNAERIVLRFARPLPAGPVRLSLAFAGTLSDDDPYGLFRRRNEGEPGVYTLFEPAGARRAFPAFDEPGWKIPWTLSLTVPTGLVALSNMPARPAEEAVAPYLASPPKPAPPPAAGTPRSRRAAVAATRRASGPGAVEPPAATDGAWQTVRFPATPPLPAHLLTFAVGRFDERGAEGPGGLPMRVIAPRGRGAEADAALALLPRLVAWQEDFLGMPMPFTQLDSLAVPVGLSFGAMEQPGLVTYAAPALLARANERTAAFERGLLSLAAHETAHQWFGNLVTMRWWDELWLKESFANWLGDRSAAALMPDADFDLSAVRARSHALQVDRLPGGRAVIAPVERDDDFGDLWNGITYDKGQALLAMAEGWLGPERFRAALRRYLERHAWGHATSDDFLAALAEADAPLARALPGFLREGGVPLLRATLRCGEGAPPRLELAAAPLRLLGAPAPAPAPRWTLPLRVRTPAGESRLMLDGSGTLALPDAACPAWVQANADGLGYWVTSPGGQALRRLAHGPVALPAAEVLALLDDARLLHQAGELDTATVLALVPRAAAHPRRPVVTAAAGLLRAMAPLAASPSGYAAAWQSAFGERARALGWQPRAGESADERLLRAALVPLVAEWGEPDSTDPTAAPLRADALRRARAWLADMNTVDTALRGPLLATAALSDDAALFDALAGAARVTPDAKLRRDLLVALGHFGRGTAPVLAQRARALLLDEAIEPREGLPTLLARQAAHPATRADALAFIARERAALARRGGPDDAAAWPELFADACGDDEARALRAVFEPHAARLQGGRKALDRTLAAAATCGAWRTHHGPLPAPDAGAATAGR